VKTQPAYHLLTQTSYKLIL